MRGTWWVSAEEQFTLVQILNSHSLGLKTVNNSVTGVEEITPDFVHSLQPERMAVWDLD